MKKSGADAALADPFGERPRRLFRTRAQVLGGEFRFESNNRRLLHLVDAAYGGLPAHVLQTPRPVFQIALRVTSEQTLAGLAEPPQLRLRAGAGLFCGMLDAGNFVTVSPQNRSALVVFSGDMLAHPYHARYELIEFAVYMLAARCQSLVPLHAGCIGRRESGVLMIGQSGTGKSTLALHCLRAGMELLSEDSVLVTPQTLQATGVGSYLHLRKDSLNFLQNTREVARISRSAVIRRRSGIEKYEVDVRRTKFAIASCAMRIRAGLFLSKRTARARDRGALLVPLTAAQIRKKLEATQCYAASQPGWPEFSRRLAAAGAFELRRGRHPQEAVEAVETLL
jgi:hypothetical protein